MIPQGCAPYTHNNEINILHIRKFNKLFMCDSESRRVLVCTSYMPPLAPGLQLVFKLLMKALSDFLGAP
jgi:hypothetical protein